MTYLDTKAAKELFKAFGPTEDDKKKYAQTFLGSLIGQSILLAGELAIYFSVCVFAVTGFFPKIKEFRDSYGLGWLIFAVVAPLVFIVAFQMVPTVLRARRESRLRQAAIIGKDRIRPGYFRLTPYEKRDRNVFRRLDGADDVVFEWLKGAQQSLLYLSGASGVGKSSILAADIEPRLSELGWTILEARLVDDPVDRISRMLFEAKGLFTQTPDAQTGLRDLLALAAESCTKEGKAPLLIIIDQFEEFLILNKTEQRAPFAAFLQELAAKPIEGLHLLLVYRSDYLALIFKLALPPPAFGKNWIEIAPYNRGEATKFVQGGGRRFSEEALDALFRGLDRIEEARGIYRLITLNMVGLILERMGQKLDENPERLI